MILGKGSFAILFVSSEEDYKSHSPPVADFFNPDFSIVWVSYSDGSAVKDKYHQKEEKQKELNHAAPSQSSDFWVIKILPKASSHCSKFHSNTTVNGGSDESSSICIPFSLSSSSCSSTSTSSPVISRFWVSVNRRKAEDNSPLMVLQDNRHFVQTVVSVGRVSKMQRLYLFYSNSVFSYRNR